MPQMAPMNWLILFVMFTVIFLMFNTLNYFNFMHNFNVSMKFTKSKTKTNWKW
uniref:ATP synthase complex subunit 8 n=1 Tax=Ochthebius paradoxus TaxID=2108343 RepID=A0A7H0DLB6_9COLE|nr:ATP synthase F0 subunit 8 [Ochthebius paradoxus]